MNVGVHFLIGLLLLSSSIAPSDAQSGSHAVPLPIYKPKPGACYVLLRPRWPDHGERIASSNEPICKAVLDNFNKYCSEAPQYDKRKIHPTSRELNEPDWVPMDAASNLELIKWARAPYEATDYREMVWAKVEGQARSGQAKLKRADIENADLRGGVNTVYMVENLYPDRDAGSNQPWVMFAERGRSTPSPLFNLVDSFQSQADLWRFQGQWYLVGYVRDYGESGGNHFQVRELFSSLASANAPVSALTNCTIDHISAWKNRGQ